LQRALEADESLVRKCLVNLKLKEAADCHKIFANLAAAEIAPEHSDANQ